MKPTGLSGGYILSSSEYNYGIKAHAEIEKEERDREQRGTS